MTKVTVHDLSVEMAQGEAVAPPFRALHVIQTPCTKGTCGSCALRVLCGEQSMAAPTDTEVKTLQRRHLDSRHWRLVCQCTVAGDGEIKLERGSL